MPFYIHTLVLPSSTPQSGLLVIRVPVVCMFALPMPDVASWTQWHRHGLRMILSRSPLTQRLTRCWLPCFQHLGRLSHTARHKICPWPFCVSSSRRRRQIPGWFTYLSCAIPAGHQSTFSEAQSQENPGLFRWQTLSSLSRTFRLVCRVAGTSAGSACQEPI